MILRPATIHDRDAVLSIRNHPEIVAGSLSRQPASDEWWDHVLEKCYVIEEGSVVAGYLLLEPIDLLSIVVAPACQGRGLGTEALKEVGGLAFIKHQNVASRNAFARAGFKELEPVVVVRK